MPALCVHVCVRYPFVCLCPPPSELQLQIQAPAEAPALLTTGLIYAIKKLIRVINSARAKALPGPYSWLWNLRNPPPHTHMHIYYLHTE